MGLISTLRSGMSAKTLKLATASAAVLGLGASIYGAPAQALYYVYNINGTFGNNTGPDQKGTFKGKFVWDTTAGGATAPVYGTAPTVSWTGGSTPGGYTPGTGSGGWSYWDIDTYAQSDPSQATSLYKFLSTGAGSACFGSPLAKGGAAAGSYYESDPGVSDVCTGNPIYHQGTSTGIDLFLAIHNTQPYSWVATGTNYTAGFSYFRLPFAGSPIAGGLTSAGGNTQSKEWFGWGALTNGLNPTTADPANALSMTCNGANAFPNSDPLACPYSGNNTNNQGVGSATTDLQIQYVPAEGVPAPLPLAGAVPLGVALRKLSKKRSSLLDQDS